MNDVRIRIARWLFPGLLAAIALSLGLRSTAPASAAFPGANGKIAFTVRQADDSWDIFVMNADGGNQTNLTNSPAFEETSAEWSADGRRIAFQRKPLSGSWDVYVMNSHGNDPVNLTNHPSEDGEPAWSPDGAKIAFTTTRDGNPEIYVMNANGSNPTRLTNNPAVDGSPVWSPDGAKIAFITTRDDPSAFEIYVMDADGGNPVNLTNNPGDDTGPSWSPDGSRIAFTGSDYEIYVMNADGNNPIQLTDNNVVDYLPSWSPDGRQIAFTTIRQDRYDIYVMNSDGSGQTNLTSNARVDFNPNWQPAPPSDANGALFLSATAGGSVNGITFGVEDILRHDLSGGSWSLFFDGSVASFSKAAASFALKEDGSILLTPRANVTLPGLGTVTPWDVVRYAPASGNFQWYLDGSDIGLTTAAEKIDALEVLSDGRVLISTTGNLAVPKPGGGTLKAQDEDLLAFTPTATGANSAGTWALYFNGTAVPGLGVEDITGVAVDVARNIYVVLQNGFNVIEETGGPKDILVLRPSAGGNYTVARFWRGPEHGFNFNIGGLELP